MLTNSLLTAKGLNSMVNDAEVLNYRVQCTVLWKWTRMCITSAKLKTWWLQTEIAIEIYGKFDYNIIQKIHM